jgi:hypothetical protein
VLKCQPQDATIRILRSLQADKAAGKFQQPDAKLSVGSSPNSDIDAVLAHHLKVTVLVFTKCLNGGGLVVTSWHGVEQFSKSKFIYQYILQAILT